MTRWRWSLLVRDRHRLLYEVLRCNEADDALVAFGGRWAKYGIAALAVDPVLKNAQEDRALELFVPLQLGGADAIFHALPGGSAATGRLGKLPGDIWHVAVLRGIRRVFVAYDKFDPELTLANDVTAETLYRWQRDGLIWRFTDRGPM